MRIWKVHPKYLDQKGLSGQWFEAIIAKNSLISKDGYWYNNPQMDIFKNSEDPIDAVNSYLEEVWVEGIRRGYKFKSEYFDDYCPLVTIPITHEDLYSDMNLLGDRVHKRDIDWYNDIWMTGMRVVPHPLFKVI